MAVRVRKLARELDRSAEDLLLLLRDLGYERFRSPDDMIAEPVAEQLRKAAKRVAPRALASDRTPGPARSATPLAEHYRTAPLESAEKVRLPRPLPPSREGESVDDFMATVVPGIVRTPVGAHERSPGRTELEVARLEAEKLAAVREREAAAAERDALRAERAALEALRAEVQAERTAVAVELREAEAARSALAAAQAEAEGASLLALFEERGLRGVDEAERALGALAAAHAVSGWIRFLLPTDAAAIRRVLADRLVLLPGPPPEGLGAVPAVVVSEDRADLPASERLQRQLARIGERMLLHGRRRVVLVGVPPRWHGVLRAGLDRRVEVVFRPSGSEPGEIAVLWEGAQRSSLVDFLDRWLGAFPH